jgi:hypothetical protein
MRTLKQKTIDYQPVTLNILHLSFITHHDKMRYYLKFCNFKIGK